MGGALLSGWLKAGVPPEHIAVFEPQAGAMPEGVAHNPDAAALAEAPPTCVVLAIKPQQAADALPELKDKLPPACLVVSLLAGTRIATLRGLLGDGHAYIRAMPNLPAAIGKGMAVLCADAEVEAAHWAQAEKLLEAVGITARADDEAQMDAITALSGSGPAYIFHVAEAMQAGGKALGLSEELAARLTMQTIVGAGAMLEAGGDATALRESVASRGGTTEAALDVLMNKAGLESLFRNALEAAAARSRELDG